MSCMELVLSSCRGTQGRAIVETGKHSLERKAAELAQQLIRHSLNVWLVMRTLADFPPPTTRIE